MATWQTTTFEDRLEELGMSPACEQEEWSGLKLVADLETEDQPAIRIALENARYYGADAVFFRQFPDTVKRDPLPQMYIYDRMRHLDARLDDFGEIQRKLWNAEIVPVAAVLTIGQVRIFSCREQPDYTPLGERFHCQWFKKLESALAAEKMLLRHGIESGLLWEYPKFADKFSFKRSAHNTLLDHLRHYKEDLLKTRQLEDATVKRVLVMSILLKYLDDRKGSDGNSVFPKDFLGQFARGKAKTLADLFTIPGACIDLFDNLSRHFNGGIFVLSENERKQLQSADLTPVARFMKGTREPGGQLVFWRLYSFNDLPVELVSNIYEEFLAKDGSNSQGIVYTPPILAELLLGETLPLDPESLNWRILDPACGSGIFLVGAFRRLVQCWRMTNGWKQPGHTELKHILRENIFGCDLKKEAVQVAAFSLCVALCDELDPKVIWEELQFDDLQRENLRDVDFFEFIDDKTTPKEFDLVIGNPPFGSKLTTQAAKDVEAKAQENRPALPDTQLALLFLDQVFNICRTGGTVCLIQPAGPLLYNVQAREFRNYLLDTCDIREVLDFTPLDSVLFKANVAAAAIVAINQPPGDDKLLHIIFRRTCSSKDRLLLETDYYDLHWLGRDYIKKNPYAWKVNLLGGGRLHRMIERFVDAPTLGDFLNKKRQNGWVAAEGYNVGAARKANLYKNREELIKLSDIEVRHRLGIKARIRRGPHLFQRKFVPTKAVTVGGIEKEKCDVLTDVFFERDRALVKSIFQPPHVLIRETVVDGHLPVAISNEELVFSKQIYGVHAPPGEEDELKELASRLSQSDLYAALLAATSSRYLVGKATSLLASDLMGLPYPGQSDLELTEWEEELVEDVVRTLALFRQKGENATAVQPVSKQDLKAFASTYCRCLNAIYKEFRALKPIFIGEDKAFVCYPFCYGEDPKIDLPSGDEAEAVVAQLCHKQHGPRLFINRIIRLYEQNVILMIKPNQKRFWLRSVAMRDADETVAELIEAGY